MVKVYSYQCIISPNFIKNMITNKNFVRVFFSYSPFRYSIRSRTIWINCSQMIFFLQISYHFLGNIPWRRQIYSVNSLKMYTIVFDFYQFQKLQFYQYWMLHDYIYLHKWIMNRINVTFFERDILLITSRHTTYYIFV